MWRAIFAAILLAGCAGPPWETNNVTKDGRIYRAREVTESGDARQTINFRAADF